MQLLHQSLGIAGARIQILVCHDDGIATVAGIEQYSWVANAVGLDKISNISRDFVSMPLHHFDAVVLDLLLGF